MEEETRQKLSYSLSQLPNSEEVFFRDLKKGDSYEVGGCINEKTAGCISCAYCPSVYGRICRVGGGYLADLAGAAGGVYVSPGQHGLDLVFGLLADDEAAERAGK